MRGLNCLAINHVLYCNGLRVIMVNNFLFFNTELFSYAHYMTVLLIFNTYLNGPKSVITVSQLRFHTRINNLNAK